MNPITWSTDVNAPCCPGEIVAEDGRSILVQTDWDYPSVAQSFGWSLRNVQRCPYCGGCDHSSTDGTVDCPECGVTAGAFIAAAGEWLRDNDGTTAEDPGYFEEEG